MKGVILDSQTLKPSELDFSDLEKLLPEWTFYEQSGPDDVKNRLRGVTVAITNKVVIDADTLAASPDLKLICISATGTNNVDLEAARRRVDDRIRALRTWKGKVRAAGSRCLPRGLVLPWSCQSSVKACQSVCSP